MSNVKEKGMLAEYYVIDKLQDREQHVEYIDSYYDILINKKVKVEIKSALLSIKHKIRNSKQTYEYGKFDFTDENNRARIWKENMWICFVARWRSEFMIIGFIKAKKLQNKRHHRLTKLRDEKLYTIDEFIKEINK